MRVAPGLERCLVNRHLDGGNGVHLEPGRVLVSHPADPVGLHRLHVAEAEQGVLSKWQNVNGVPPGWQSSSSGWPLTASQDRP